jgi:beta-phosphoglucomutase
LIERAALLNLKGILFDMDGVLIKSMEQHLAAWQYAYKNHGVNIKKIDFYLLEGRGVKAVVNELTKMYDLDIKLAPSIMKTKINYYNKNYKAEFYEGLFELLSFLQDKKIKMAVVTGASRERVYRLIKNHFNGYFSAFVTSDDVMNTKPFAEPYQKGAQLLGLKPDECLVVENAPMGIKSGKDAGMQVLAVQTTLNHNYLKQADYIVPNIPEAHNIIFKLINNSGNTS